MVVAEKDLVFISYARADMRVASKIVDTLEGLGLETWFDQGDVLGGQRFKDAIERGIETAAALVLILSPNSLASAWCLQEWRHAQSRGKPVIPALIAPVDSAANPLAEVHWIDFTDHADRDRFDHAIYLMLQAICKQTALRGAEPLLKKAQHRTGAERIDVRLEDIRDSTRSTEAWLRKIDAEAPKTPPQWRDSDQQQTTDRLVRLAIGEELRDRQIMAHAAQSIARTGNLSALRALADRIDSGDWTAPVYAAAHQMTLVRDDPAPRRLTPGQRLRLLVNVGVRQLRETPITPPIFWALVAAIGALWIASFTQFGIDTEEWTRARRAAAVATTAYGIVLGIGIAFTLFVAPRLRVLRLWRYLIGAVVGWLLVLAAFVGDNDMGYYRSLDEYLATLPALSAVFIAGYALAVFIPSGTPLHLAGRIALSFLGVFLALLWPCDWRNVHPRLIIFERNACPAEAKVWISVFLAMVPFTAEAWAQLTERGGILTRSCTQLWRRP